LVGFGKSHGGEFMGRPTGRWNLAFFDGAVVCAGSTTEHGQVEGGCAKGRERYSRR
jgi:hypothetical protein